MRVSIPCEILWDPASRGGPGLGVWRQDRVRITKGVCVSQGIACLCSFFLAADAPIEVGIASRSSGLSAVVWSTFCSNQHCCASSLQNYLIRNGRKYIHVVNTARCWMRQTCIDIED